MRHNVNDPKKTSGDGDDPRKIIEQPPEKKWPTKIEPPSSERPDGPVKEFPPK